jgi:hypothetical protein
MDGNGREDRLRPHGGESGPKDGPVRRAAKAVARRDLFRHGGRFAVVTAAASAWLLAGAREEAHAGSPGCWTLSGCTCGGNQTCNYIGTPNTCEPRRNDCPPSGVSNQCWCEGCRRYCDYWCHGRACHCSNSPQPICGC